MLGELTPSVVAFSPPSHVTTHELDPLIPWLTENKMICLSSKFTWTLDSVSPILAARSSLMNTSG